jgi:hypothetical protein
VFSSSRLAYVAVTASVEIRNVKLKIVAVYLFQKHFAFTRHMRHADGAATLLERARIPDVKGDLK